MNRPFLLQRRNTIRLGALAGVLLIGVAVFGWSAGYTPPPPPPPKSERAWSLPQPKVEDSAKDLAALTSRKPWGEAAAGLASGSRPAGPKVKWRLAGVVQRGGESMVLIASGPVNATKFDYFRVGDKLPDGGVLLEIAPDSAVVQDGASEGKQVYQLFEIKK